MGQGSSAYAAGPRGASKSQKTAFVSAVQSYEARAEQEAPGRKVAVVGSGCAGLAAAWHLHKSGCDVTLLESEAKLGGHANTIDVKGVPCDTGFMVFNERNYPNLLGLFAELGVEYENTNMGFSVSMDNGSFEWCGDSWKTLSAMPSNLFNPEFYTMFRDINRFNDEGKRFLAGYPSKPLPHDATVRDFLACHGLSDAFANYYLLPMTSAIWSASGREMLEFPIVTLLTFLDNHLLLQLTGHQQWKTPAGRSRVYVDKIAAILGDHARCNAKVVSVTRTEDGKLRVRTEDGFEDVFAEVVFACHPDQAKELIREVDDGSRARLLSAFHYARNDVYLHSDDSLMPVRKGVWASWNYLGTTKAAEMETKPVFVTYWLNRLQNLDAPEDIFVSLNPYHKPAADKIHAQMVYDHPQFTADTIRAQGEVARIQGRDGLWFCGAWMGYGFHEDGVRSGLEVAVAICGQPVPWVSRLGPDQMIPARAGMAAAPSPLTLSYYLQPIRRHAEALCREAVFHFLRGCVKRGCITFKLPDGKAVSIGQTHLQGSAEEVIVQVFSMNFFVRIALESSLGLGRSYIAGEWEVEGTGRYSDGLTRFLTVLLKNKVNSSESLSSLVTAWLGSTINVLRYKLAMDNSLAGSRTHIHAHYDLSNDLFKLFLDREVMAYSCALFETRVEPSETPGGAPRLKFVDTLESAQIRKIDTLLDRLHLSSEHRLLDIGFGWGGLAIRAAERFGCRVYGITLSEQQKLLAEQKVAERNLQHLIRFELVDYREFAKRRIEPFDRIVSCEMIEAVGHNYLPDYFEAIEKLLAPDGIVVMQTITAPESRYRATKNGADFINTIIFPGGCCPSLQAMMEAMEAKSNLHLERLDNINLHYAETLRRWRKRFNSQLPRALELGFDDCFIRCWNYYLCYCETGFEQQVMNTLILTFSRPGNQNLIADRDLGVIVN